MPKLTEDDLLDREQIDGEKVENLSADELIRLFTMRLATYNHRHNLSKSRCVGEIAKEFRDDYGVNILRIIDERDYVHPDGVFWNIGPLPEDTIRKFDPVLPESKEEGGTADFRSGDIIVLDGDPLVVVGTNDSHLVGMNKSAKLDSHPLAAVRELFNSDKYSPALVRDAEVVRGVLDRDVEDVTDSRPRSGGF